MELLLFFVLQTISVVAMYWAGRWGEQARTLRRGLRALEARRAEYEASDRGQVELWTFAGWLRCFDDLRPGTPPKRETPVEDRPEWGAR